MSYWKFILNLTMSQDVGVINTASLGSVSQFKHCPSIVSFNKKLRFTLSRFTQVYKINNINGS